MSLKRVIFILFIFLCSLHPRTAYGQSIHNYNSGQSEEKDEMEKENEYPIDENESSTANSDPDEKSIDVSSYDGADEDGFDAVYNIKKPGNKETVENFDSHDKSNEEIEKKREDHPNIYKQQKTDSSVVNSERKLITGNAGINVYNTEKAGGIGSIENCDDGVVNLQDKFSDDRGDNQKISTSTDKAKNDFLSSDNDHTHGKGTKRGILSLGDIFADKEAENSSNEEDEKNDEQNNYSSSLVGSFTKKAEVVLISLRSGENHTLELNLDKEIYFSDFSLKLRRCWRDSDTEVLADSRALIELLNFASGGQKRNKASSHWFSVRYGVLGEELPKNILGAEYVLMLSECK